MGYDQQIEFSQETSEGVAQLLRFLTLPREFGYTFASSRDERLIPMVNAQIADKAKQEGKTIKIGFLQKESDTYLLAQLTQLAQDADSLIVPNIGEFISWDRAGDSPEDHRFLSELNFAREGITAIGKPILFWASEKMIHLLTQQAQDLFSQRRMSTVYFEQRVPLDTEWMRLPDLEREEVDTEGLLLKQASLRGQLDVAKRLAWPPSRIAAELGIPLANVDSQLGEHDAAIHLLDQYKPDLKNPDAVTLLQCLLVELRAGRQGTMDQYWDGLYLANRKPYEFKRKLTEIAKIASSLGDPYLYAQALDWIGRTLMEAGQLDEAEAVYKAYLENILALERANPDAELIQRRLARAYRNVGEIRQNQGHFELASEAYQRGLEIVKNLALRNTNSETLLRDLAISHVKTGLILQSQGHLDEAVEAIRQGLEILQQLADKNPGSETLQRDLLACYAMIGDIHDSKRHIQKAKEHFQHCLKISAALLQTNPDSFQIREDHFLTLVRIARIDFRKKNSALALNLLQEALTEAQFLAEHRGTPDDLYWLQTTKDRIAALRSNLRPPGW